MKKRSSTGGKAAKARPRKVLKLKGRNFPKPPRSSSSADELMRVTRERDESLQQQTATSDVLQVISRSPGDLQPVFETILENAVRIRDAKFGNIYRWDGNVLNLVATHNTPRAYAEARRRSPVRPNPNNIFGSMVATKTVVHILDAAKQREQGNLEYVAAVELGGVRTCIAVPMLKENELIGSISLFRQEVCPFTDKQIALITNFAAQAVIAIENARLLNELHQRTTDLSQRTADLTVSLEQQTATSEVLQVISSAPGDLEPVFAAMLEKALRICEAKFGMLYRHENCRLRLIAARDVPPMFASAQEGPFTPVPGGMLDSVMKTGRTVHLPDLAATQAYLERHPIMVEAVELAGIRTTVGVPMIHENELVGLIGIYRQDVRPFTDKQIALLASFAAQAVIAIENARLLNELRESLEQQTATSEVLRVISTSPSELQPVFSAILANGARLCEAKFGVLVLYENETLRIGAMHNVPDAYAEYRRREPVRVEDPQTVSARVAATKELVHVLDYAAEMPDNPVVRLGGARSAVAVPMLKENELLGAIIIYRQEVRAFTEKQIALLTSFAAQAVIAIENTRLLSELHESLQEQTATSEVLQVISSSPGDVQPVFDTMLEKAVRICDAKFGNIYRWDGDALRLVATHNTPPDYAKHRRHSPFRADQNNAVARMIASKKVVHLLDAAGNEAYTERRDPTVVAAVELGGIRSALAVPMLREDELIGAFIVSRQEVRPFTDKQIALVTNFAAQAVIAIENTRLLKELRERTGELEVQSREVIKLNQQLEQRVADQVGEIERMGRLRRFLPPQVADLIVASGTEKQLESHRREITALFCDLRGFTGFTESADAEDVMALLREYHAAIGEIIIRYNGTLERYAGDGVMVVFNDPIPVDNPALQAVQMALEMREAIGALTEKWRQLGHEIGFGIGIAHGYATLGTIGFEGRHDYAAIGTVSNVASRLCDEAKPGQILVSPRVLVAVRDAVALEAVGEFELKGIRRPIAAYNVLAALPPSP